MSRKRVLRETAVAVLASCAIIAAQVAALPYIVDALFTHVVSGALFFAAPALPWLPMLFGAGEVSAATGWMFE